MTINLALTFFQKEGKKNNKTLDSCCLIGGIIRSQRKEAFILIFKKKTLSGIDSGILKHRKISSNIFSMAGFCSNPLYKLGHDTKINFNMYTSVRGVMNKI